MIFNWLNRRSSFTKAFFFAICCAFIFGGAVNNGSFSYLPAVPFLVPFLYAGKNWGRRYLIICASFSVICLSLYFLRKQNTRIFYPALGKEYLTVEDSCITEYNGFVLMSNGIDKSCDASNMSGSKKTMFLPRGSKLQVAGVSVSHTEFAENYLAHSPTPIGDLQVDLVGNKPFTWVDGSAVRESDLRRDIFYYPSLLMYWPMSPLMLFTVFR